MLTPPGYRTFVVYWITVLLAGGFVFGGVLCLQGIAPRLLAQRYFLRVSGILQDMGRIGNYHGPHDRHAFLLTYFRTMRRIAEEPDVTPG